MGKDIIKDIAKLLNVEMNEDFIIKNCFYNPYHFEEKKGLIDCNGKVCPGLLGALCIGEVEIERVILTDKEKKYLENVLKPFKDRIMYIKKTDGLIGCFIAIFIKGTNGYDEEMFNFPYFDENKIYKGMKIEKKYTLKDLKLFEES